MCSGRHKNVPIAGKVLHLGRWISLSEYAARYSSGFGKNVARYLARGFLDPPLVREELLVCDSDMEFVNAAVARKRQSESEDTPAGLAPGPKQIRYLSVPVRFGIVSSI